MNIIFDSEQDAVSVAEQLYNVERLDNILFIQNIDLRALNLAIALVQVKVVKRNASLRCMLPFPDEERECTDEETPKIYVACLSAYNAGYLHGLWIDGTQQPEDIEDDIKWMLSWSPVADTESCDEWAIHDYECWQGIQLSEYEDIETVSELAQLLEEHGKAYAVYYQHYGSNYATEEDFKDRYLGEYEDEKDFVHQMWEECGKIQQLEELNIPAFYIDWKAIAQDWFIDSYFSIEVGLREIYIFNR
ncbi:antirestriction protein [Rivularia sp. PCC 7116]|uniref:antirestriction protein ArdA n=1 Tax=Rivularia sp. PCC 7116 TaxID=373994 RepID=UPI00029F205D|nr:antirestriction protein ArdA [Rivularia sp. PCC 7116]AFY57332.1 antirestriction protein [Rivularia sp. PCC 7116]